ncbi:uracil-DNA glycosylase [Micromonospora sp. NPDC003197]
MDLTSAARANRDPDTVKAKLARLDEPHIAPFSRLVEEIRVLVGHQELPYVDPTFGGVAAEVLFLSDAPSRTAATKSTLLSLDNDEATSAHLWEFYRAAGLARERCVHWTALPWLPADSRRRIERGTVESALPWLARLIDLLPQLKLVVTMGEVARQAFSLYQFREDAHLVPWLAVAPPTGRTRTASPLLWDDIERAFDVAARVTATERGRP